MRTNLRMAACLTALLAPALVHGQSADNYPSKIVTVVIPNGPGGPADVEARMWMALLAANLGQTFVADNKPGAGLTVGLGYLAKQKPDGYHLGTATSNVPLIGLRYPQMGLDPVKGFTHISVLHERRGLLVVHSSLPITSVKEYVAYARANPGVLNFSSAGNGSTDHVTGAWLMSATKTVGAMKFIHYKSSPSAYADLLAGRVHMAAIPYSQDGPYGMVKSGKLRNMGTTSAQRSPLAPDVPTFQEQGLAGFDVSSAVALLGPAKMPSAIVSKLHAEILKVSKMPQLKQQLGEANSIVASTPEMALRAMATQEDRYRKLGQELGIDYTQD